MWPFKLKLLSSAFFWSILCFVISQNGTRIYSEFLFWALLSLHGEDDEKRYLKFKVFSKACVNFVWAYLLNANSCVLSVLFSGRTFSRERIEDGTGGTKRSEKRKKALNRSKRNKDKISFL